ncbi:hypothetical protein EV656_10925 [Rhodovulum adriaticum]|uniref:DUF484 family protein n=2 Tax=Rhodovulum adriaticum TaxID=35804 RepID=A0A4R2NJR4_RHOAD|nr:DUF484 family protein [Rhodovulum adriaticum]MBK1635592.1 recombinase XerC [Rhodovulum adriaticum]TCP21773.1 hypothetical protein EV656_10925 [Rhodovulum adriaticum]
MGSTPAIAEDLRARIIAAPEVILDDPDVMRALVAANEKTLGANIVDLRGIAMERLEARLDRLEDTHRSVIAAAYDNLSGTNLIHRAVLRLLDPLDFESFLANLPEDVAAVLRVDCVKLVLESAREAESAALGRLGAVVHVAPPGFVDRLTGGMQGGNAARPVTLRQGVPGSEAIYGPRAADLRSEALLRLDLGKGRLPGMLALGSEDPHQFAPGQGTDLLAFFAGVFERAMRRWLG